MVRGSGDHEETGRLPEETRSWSVPQASQLGYPTEAEIKKLELGNQLKRTWQNLLREYFDEAMRKPPSALPLMGNPFIRTAGQLMFAWSLLGIQLEVLTSNEKIEAGQQMSRGLSIAFAAHCQR